MEKPTQANRILEVLKKNLNQWINGRYFCHTMRISQFHTRIFELQKRGEKIDSSNFKDEFGFKSYRVLGDKVQTKLFN